jgi:hypothetical protein
MMNIVGDVIELVKHTVAKSVTVGITYIVANNGLQVVFGYLFGPQAVSLLEVKLLLLGTALAITQKAIVPIIEEAIAEIQKKKVTAVKDSKFTIINF